jgi:UDP-glucuronate decarboxylase
VSNVLVLGASGTIGRALVPYLKVSGLYEVREVDHRPAFRDGFRHGDLLAPLDLVPHIAWADVVVNLAGVVSRVIAADSPSLAYHANVAGALDVALLADRLNAKLVHLSTSEVYGPNLDTMSEDDQLHPNNRYGLTNAIAESALQYETTIGLELVILRPFMVYGPDEEEGDHRSAVRRFTTALLVDRELIVHEGAMRSWLFIDDAVDAIERAIATDLPTGTVLNIGSPDVRPVRDVADLLAAELDLIDPRIREVPLPPRMTLVKKPALERAEELLSFTANVTLEEGIAIVAEDPRLLLGLAPDST